MPMLPCCKLHHVVARLPAILLLALCCTAAAQRADTTRAYTREIARQIDSLKKIQADMDTLQAQQLKRLTAEAMRRDSISMVNNLNSYMQRQRAQNERIKKQLWLKGGIFAMLLVITVVGYVKRRRAKVKG